MNKIVWMCFLFLNCLTGRLSAQITINEISSSNSTTIQNGSQGYDDWIELYNGGTSGVNLQGFGLSDDSSEIAKFKFPNYLLPAGQRVLVFASDKENTSPIDHFEMAVDAAQVWKYFVGTTNPDTNWRNLSFNANPWSNGTGGFGFGDNDDQTTIQQTKSVFVRKTFIVSDTSEIVNALFQIDYDDGFVAFLNGVEIARSNVGVVGDRPGNTTLASTSHEATMYLGFQPDSFFISSAKLKSILRQGQNVLAVQVHNFSATSNDLTCRPFLFFGMKDNSSTFSTPPSWFIQPPQEHFSAAFKLSRSGETVFLSNGQNQLIDQKAYALMQNDHSLARNPDGSANWCIASTPTPGTSNTHPDCFTYYMDAPSFSVSPGIYDAFQSVELLSNNPNAEIHFTLNGDEPTINSTVYSAPILISSSTTIRAKSFSSNALPSATLTGVFIINDVSRLPIFTITTDSVNLWDYNTGIYVTGPDADTVTPFHGANFWQDWKRPASIEYYDTERNRLFAFDADISIYGNYSRAKPQKSFEISLKDKYGTPELHYSFWPDKPNVDVVSDLVLRNAGSDWNKVHFRDALMERIMKKTHSGYLATTPAVMYLNGKFWGVYTIHENHDENWVKNNYGLKKSEIDFLKESGNSIEVKSGTDEHYWNTYNYILNQNPATATYYAFVDSTWDLKNYYDYFIAETYYNNGDWIGDWTNNIKLWRPLSGDQKWKYLLYDTDFGLGLHGTYTDNRLSQALHPVEFSYSSEMLKKVLQNPTIKRDFINRYCDLMNTVYLPWYMIGVVHSFQDSMQNAMPEHFSKWGGTMQGWQTFIDSMQSFIYNRPAYARSFIKSEFNLGNAVNLTFTVNDADAGRIVVSTIIPDTLPWTGAYFDGNPVTINVIPNPGYTFSHWHSQYVINTDDPLRTTTYNFNRDDSITAYFTGSAQSPMIAVTEFNYNSSPTADAGDWIELHNYGNFDVDISGWKLKDEDDLHAFVFPINTVIPAGGYLVVAEDTTKFKVQYPLITNMIGPTGFNFANHADQIRLLTYQDQEIFSFYYQDISPWPLLADGGGYTCEKNGNTADPADGANWFNGCLGGSPGRAFTNSLLIAPLITGNTSFCAGGTVNLFVEQLANYSYQWQFNNQNIPNATDTFYSANAAGRYTIRYSSQGCFATSAPFDVTSVNQAADPIVTSDSRCGSGTVTLNAIANDSVYWYATPGGSILASGSSFTTPFITTTQIYYARASLVCPGNYVPVTAAVNPIPNDPVVRDTFRCGPGSINLAVNDTAAVRWYSALTGGTLVNTGSAFTVPFISTDTVFYVEAGSGCVSSRVALAISVIAPPAPEVSDGSHCGPGAVVLNAISTLPVDWYEQSSGGVAVGSGNSFTTDLLNETDTFYAESNNGCASERVAAIAYINAVPDEPIVVSGSRCDSGTVALTATAGVQIFWYDQATGGSPLSSGSNFTTPVIYSSTTYFVEAEDICSSERVPVTAFIHLSPIISLGIDTAIESGTSIQLSAGTGFTNYIWSTGDTTASIIASVEGDYAVSVVDSNQCSGSDTISISLFTGINNSATNDESFHVFPNPAHDQLVVHSPVFTNGNISIINATGQLIMENKMSGSLTKINVSALPIGAYQLTIVGDGKIFHLRFIKE